MKDILSEFYKKVLSFFNTETKEENSKDTACNRLKLVLMQDRAKMEPALMEKMREEMIEVISKYVVIDKEALDLNLEAEGESFALMLNIPVIRAKTREEIEEEEDDDDENIDSDENSDNEEDEAQDTEEDVSLEEDDASAENDDEEETSDSENISDDNNEEQNDNPNLTTNTEEIVKKEDNSPNDFSSNDVQKEIPFQKKRRKHQKDDDL